MGIYEMKDDAKNIEIINSILYSEVFRPSPSPFSTQKVTSCLLEETYHFLPLIDSFAPGLTTLLQNAFLNHLISSFEKVNYMEIEKDNSNCIGADDTSNSTLFGTEAQSLAYKQTVELNQF